MEQATPLQTIPGNVHQVLVWSILQKDKENKTTSKNNGNLCQNLQSCAKFRSYLFGAYYSNK
jgi:hypothetical protein